MWKKEHLANSREIRTAAQQTSWHACREVVCVWTSYLDLCWAQPTTVWTYPDGTLPSRSWPGCQMCSGRPCEPRVGWQVAGEAETAVCGGLHTHLLHLVEGLWVERGQRVPSTHRNKNNNGGLSALDHMTSAEGLQRFGKAASINPRTQCNMWKVKV